MRIYVNSSDCHLNLVIPTRAVCNGLTASIAGAALKHSPEAPDLTPEQFRALFQCLHQCKKEFPNLVLVDVDTTDGTRVTIKL